MTTQKDDLLFCMDKSIRAQARAAWLMIKSNFYLSGGRRRQTRYEALSWLREGEFFLEEAMLAGYLYMKGIKDAG